MFRSLTLAALLAVSASPALAQPTASLPDDFEFVDWLTFGSPATVGVGVVNESNKVFYAKEKLVAGFQSWYIFFDPSGGQAVSGTIEFADNITSLITGRAGLEASEAIYGLSSGITYGYEPATGLEGADNASFSGKTLTINFSATNPGDHIRVLTQAPASVPEPAPVALLSLGVAGLMIASRRRRSA